MGRGSVVFWVCLAAALAVYGIMVLGTLPEIARAAGGLRPFDMRPTGYSAEEARAFLSALSPDGRQLYLGTQHLLDTVYPALLAATLGMAIWRLSAGWSRTVRGIVCALPVLGAGFDYLENIRVAGLLRTAPADVSAEAVAAASTATLVKSGATTLGFLLLLALLALRVWRMRR